MALDAPALSIVDLTGTVRDAMDDVDQVVTVDTPVDEAMQLAVEQDLPMVVVVNDELHVVGVVSQRDLLTWCLSQDTDEGSSSDCERSQSCWRTPMRKLVTGDHPVTVLWDVPLVKAAALLASNKVNCLPVVGHSGRLQGVVTVGSLLRHVRSKSRKSIVDEFTFFAPVRSRRPSAPAYIRRLNGELVIPSKCFVENIRLTNSAQLGFDNATGRILVRFVDAGEEVESPLEVVREKDQIVIRAGSFVEHFGLSGTARTFLVEHTGPARQYLLLVPRSSNQSDTVSLR